MRRKQGLVNPELKPSAVVADMAGFIVSPSLRNIVIMHFYKEDSNVSIKTVTITMAAAVFLLFGSCKESGGPTEPQNNGKKNRLGKMG